MVSPQNPILKNSSKDNRLPFIVFLRVENKQSKLMRICDVVHKYFSLGERILISIMNETSAKFIDALLWQIPPESFLPHLIAEDFCEEPIVITQSKKNLNKASILINLQKDAFANTETFSKIYELKDLTSLEKHDLSCKREKEYKKMGLQIIEI